MPDQDEDLIKRKVENILSYLEELKPLAVLSYDDFVGDVRNVRTAERDLQLIVDAAVDVNNHIIMARGAVPPKDYFESFIKLADLKIFPRDFAEKIAQSTGLRNRLVHAYESIDVPMLFEDLSDDMKDYQRYCELVITHLAGDNK